MSQGAAAVMYLQLFCCCYDFSLDSVAPVQKQSFFCPASFLAPSYCPPPILVVIGRNGWGPSCGGLQNREAAAIEHKLHSV